VIGSQQVERDQVVEAAGLQSRPAAQPPPSSCSRGWRGAVPVENVELRADAAPRLRNRSVGRQAPSHGRSGERAAGLEWLYADRLGNWMSLKATSSALTRNSSAPMVSCGWQE